MKDHAMQISPKIQGTLLDTCGTGGDVLKTFNISTLSALVAAGAGIPVAKHGNRSVTSHCGSADVLEQAGVKIDAEPEIVENCITNANIGFMFAPVFHPAMKHVVIPRKEVGLRTVFNVLGPLTNPANAEGQILGVYTPEIMNLMGNTLQKTGVKRFFIVHNELGADEILPSGRNLILQYLGDTLESKVLKPEDFKMEECDKGELQVSMDKVQILKMFVKILKDEAPIRFKNAVLMNSALAVVAGSLTDELNEALVIARESLESGAALEKLKLMVSESTGELDQFYKFTR